MIDFINYFLMGISFLLVIKLIKFLFIFVCVFIDAVFNRLMYYFKGIGKRRVNKKKKNCPKKIG